MARRLLLCLACALLVATPASGSDIYHRKREIDERLSSLHSKIAHAKSQEGVLTDEISVADAKIGALEDDVSSAQAQLNELEAQLAASQRKLDRMNALFALQTERLAMLRREYALALARLETRLIDAYERPGVDAIDVMLASTSMSDLLDDVEYVQEIGRQDTRISRDLHTARDEMHATRERTRAIKKRVAAETALVRERTDRQHAVTEQLISAQQQLANERAAKRETLSSIKVNEDQFVRESQLLQEESATLSSKIRAAEAAARARSATPASSPSQSSGTTVPSSSGLIWPVQGPIASPFGPRCLPNGDCSFHPGIDIAVGSGTPIDAAASGTVIYAGWLGGYGNLTVIDHGNGLATAYGHQSSIGVGVGQIVGQGDVIGYVGCTGYCFGPHLHFEVRVNGEAVNPLNYL